MNRRNIITTWAVAVRIAAVLVVASVTAHEAFAAPSAAIFPFEIIDTSGEEPMAGRGARLDMATEVRSLSREKSDRRRGSGAAK
jgi:hypothetical protein